MAQTTRRQEETGSSGAARGRRGRAVRIALAAVAGTLALGAGGPAEATRITYRSIDLPDTGALDLWRYEYSVSERIFGAGEGFSVLFPVGEARDLAAIPGAVDSDWDVLVLQPEPLLASDGRYDAQAKIDGAGLLFAFSLDFHRLGAGVPGSQRFEVYDAGFAVLELGDTVPVPEPTTAILLALGLAGLARRRRSAASSSSERNTRTR